MSRWAVAQRQADLAGQMPSLAGINVFPSHPGSKWMDSECIWGLDTDGEMAYGPSTAGPKIIDDVYVQRWAIRVANRDSTADALTRLTEIADAFRDAIAATADADGLSGTGWRVTETGPRSYSYGYVDDPKTGIVAGANLDQYVELRINTGETA